MRAVISCLPLLLAACTNHFDAGDLELPVDTLHASFVQTATYSSDSDGDGVTDLTLRGLAIVLTDRDDLCATGRTVDEQEEVLAVEVIALYDETVTSLENNAGRLDVLNHPKSGDVYVGVRVVRRRSPADIQSGGALLTLYGTRNLLDPDWVDDVRLVITSEDTSDGNLKSLSANFTAVLGADYSSPAAFDTDADGDQVFDFRFINQPVKGRAVSAVPCDALRLLP